MKRMTREDLEEHFSDHLQAASIRLLFENT